MLAVAAPLLGNRTQIALFALITLVLTAGVVFGARYWVKRVDTLTIAIGDADSVETRVANKLAAMMRNSGSPIRVTPKAATDGVKPVTRFDRREADLAILRTDAKIPSRARAIAVLDRDVVLLLSRKTKIKTLAALKGQKIAVRGGDDSNETLLRTVLASFDPAGTVKLQTVPMNAVLDQLLGKDGFGGAAVIDHLSSIARDKRYEQLARQPGGFILNAIEEAKSIERRMSGVSSETIDARLLSAAPQIPEDELTTIGWQWILVAQSSLPETRIAEFARVLFENKADLALEDGFASKIEPADTDKDAVIVAHPGAAQYINDETKSFSERYSDLIYISLAALSVIGSIFVALYTAVTRSRPDKAGRYAAAMLEIATHAQTAESFAELNLAQQSLDRLLQRLLAGIADGRIDEDGIDGFRLGADYARDCIAARRERLGTLHEDRLRAS